MIVGAPTMTWQTTSSGLSLGRGTALYRLRLGRRDDTW